MIDLDGGIRVAANDLGPSSEFPIVVHHGLIASIRDVALFACLVDAGRRVLLLARPGYGNSAPVVLPNVAGWGALAEAVLDALHRPSSAPPPMTASGLPSTSRFAAATGASACATSARARLHAARRR